MQTAAERIAELEDESRRLFTAMFDNMKSSAEERYAQHERYYDIEAKLEELKASLAEETSRRLTLEASVKAVEAERDELQSSLKSAEKEVFDVSADRDDLRASLTAITAERDDLRIDLVKSKAEADTTMKTLTAYRDKLTDNLEESREEIGALRAEINTREVNFQRLKHETDGIMMKALRFRERAETAEDEVEELKERIKKDLIENDKAISDVSSQWASVLNQLSAARKDFAKQRRALNGEKAVLEKTVHLQTDELAHTNALLKYSRDEISTLREQLDDAKSQMEELKERHSFEIGLHERDNFELLDVLESKLSSHIELEERLANAEASLQHEKTESARLRKEAASLSSQLEGEREAHSRTKEAYIATQSSLNAELEAHACTQDALAAVQSRLDEVVAESARSELVLAHTNVLHEDTCDKLARVTENSRRLSRDLKQITEQRDRLLDESSFISSSSEDLRTMVATLSKETASLRVSKKSVEDAFAQKRDQCEALHLEVLRLTQAALTPEGTNTSFAASTPLRSKDLNIGTNEACSSFPSSNYVLTMMYNRDRP